VLAELTSPSPAEHRALARLPIPGDGPRPGCQQDQTPFPSVLTSVEGALS
jgi:hypothetical protein